MFLISFEILGIALKLFSRRRDSLRSRKRQRRSGKRAAFWSDFRNDVRRGMEIWLVELGWKPPAKREATPTDLDCKIFADPVTDPRPFLVPVACIEAASCNLPGGECCVLPSEGRCPCPYRTEQPAPSAGENPTGK